MSPTPVTPVFRHRRMLGMRNSASKMGIGNSGKPHPALKLKKGKKGMSQKQASGKGKKAFHPAAKENKQRKLLKKALKKIYG